MITNTVTSKLQMKFHGAISRSQSLGDMAGNAFYKHYFNDTMADGVASAMNVVGGGLTGQVTLPATLTHSEISVSTDPFGTLGDEVHFGDSPASPPTRMHTVVVENQSTVNSIQLTGDGDTPGAFITNGALLFVPPEGFIFWSNARGASQMDSSTDFLDLMAVDSSDLVSEPTGTTAALLTIFYG